MAAKKASGQEPSEVSHVPGTSVLEWVLAGASALCLTAVIASLVFIALNEPSSDPAQIRLSTEQGTESESGYVMEFSAFNPAAGSAAGVEIQGRLLDGDAVVEESRVTLDYLAKRSKQRAALVFRNDPRTHQVQLRVTGYFEP